MMERRNVLLKNINCVDVEKCCVNYNVNVLIQNDMIINVGKAFQCTECETIDCSNMFAIPSFIDMHVHITFNPYQDGDMSLKCVTSNLTEAAQVGICLVRDVGTSNRWSRDDILRSLPSIPLPDVVMSGEPLCVKNGHGVAYGTVIDYDSIPEWVRNHKQHGYEWIKIMNDPENHSEAFINKVVDLAHNNSMKVACHVFRKRGIELAVSCKCDSIEHVVPLEYAEEGFGVPYYIPTAYSAWVSCQNSYLESIDKEDAEYLIEWHDLLQCNFSHAVENSVKILCGTDAGCCPSSFRDIVCEIRTLYNMGMSPIKALQAATINSAQCLGYDNLYGSIKAGKYANIIVVPNNPLTDLNILNFPCFIYLKGIKIRDEVNGPWN